MNAYNLDIFNRAWDSMALDCLVDEIGSVEYRNFIANMLDNHDKYVKFNSIETVHSMIKFIN